MIADEPDYLQQAAGENVEPFGMRGDFVLRFSSFRNQVRRRLLQSVSWMAEAAQVRYRVARESWRMAKNNRKK